MTTEKNLFSPSFDQSSDVLTFDIVGRLDNYTVANCWNDGMAAQKKHHPKVLQINASALEFCDGAGIAFFTSLRTAQEKIKGTLQIEGLKPAFQKLLDAVERIPSKAIGEEHGEDLNIPEQAGEFAIAWWANILENLTYLGALCSVVVRALGRPSTIRWKDVLRTMEETGPNATVLIGMLGLIIGLILSFQAAAPLGQFGAKIYIVNLVGISLTRELGPLLTAILISGRTASAFAAEIGTMKVNQEIDALETLGLSPLLFLAVPRIIAVMIMVPLLTTVMIFAGLLGSAIFMGGLGFAWEVFYNQLLEAVSMGDFLGGLVKSIIFGTLLAGIGCMYGLRTKFGASSVGESTTNAVVSCLVMLVVVDSIFAVVFYALGI